MRTHYVKSTSLVLHYATAQTWPNSSMGERGAEDLVVAGSNPALATRLYKFPSLYEVAGVDTLSISCFVAVGVVAYPAPLWWE